MKQLGLKNVDAGGHVRDADPASASGGQSPRALKHRIQDVDGSITDVRAMLGKELKWEEKSERREREIRKQESRDMKQLQQENRKSAKAQASTKFSNPLAMDSSDPVAGE